MAWIKTKIKLPKKFDADDSFSIGEEIVNYLIDRTKSGKGAFGKFPKYSESYKNSFEFKVAGKSASRVDLTLSGEMLDSVKVLESSDGSVTIGFDKDDSNNDKAEGNILGSYGGNPNSSKARNFLEITESEVNKIINMVAVELDDETLVRSKPSDISKAARRGAVELMDSFEFDTEGE